jgi:hypothetical protein
MRSREEKSYTPTRKGQGRHKCMPIMELYYTHVRSIYGEKEEA